jgi:hypothetical protein
MVLLSEQRYLVVGAQSCRMRPGNPQRGHAATAEFGAERGVV